MVQSFNVDSNNNVFDGTGWRTFPAANCNHGAYGCRNRNLCCNSVGFNGRQGVKGKVTGEERIQFIVISIIYVILNITKELMKERKSKK